MIVAPLEREREREKKNNGDEEVGEEIRERNGTKGGEGEARGS